MKIRYLTEVNTGHEQTQNPYVVNPNLWFSIS